MDNLRREERALLARRNEILARFITGAKAPPADAERWVLEWEQRARQVRIRPESPAYWSTGLRWIASQREREAASREAA